MAEPGAHILRVRILKAQTGPVFFADVDEERNVLAAHGEQLIAAGQAELARPLKSAAPAAAPKARARKR